MSEQCGKLITCDRCGKNVFLKCIGEGETDGGYTKWNKFEENPNGWKYYYNTGLLCPECNEEYVDIVEEFMNWRRNENY